MQRYYNNFTSLCSTLNFYTISRPNSLIFRQNFFEKSSNGKSWVKNNIFEGINKGFEVSQEYYKISNGINNHVIVKGNRIRAKARRNNYGVIDIRHARNVVVKKNKITSLYRDKTAYVLLASCQNVIIDNNKFSFDKQPLGNTILKMDLPSPENGVEVPELNIKDLKIQEIVIKEK